MALYYLILVVTISIILLLKRFIQECILKSAKASLALEFFFLLFAPVFIFVTLLFLMPHLLERPLLSYEEYSKLLIDILVLFFILTFFVDIFVTTTGQIKELSVARVVIGVAVIWVLVYFFIPFNIFSFDSIHAINESVPNWLKIAFALFVLIKILIDIFSTLFMTNPLIPGHKKFIVRLTNFFAFGSALLMSPTKKFADFLVRIQYRGKKIPFFERLSRLTEKGLRGFLRCRHILSFLAMFFCFIIWYFGIVIALEILIHSTNSQTLMHKALVCIYEFVFGERNAYFASLVAGVVVAYFAVAYTAYKEIYTAYYQFSNLARECKKSQQNPTAIFINSRESEKNLYNQTLSQYSWSIRMFPSLLMTYDKYLETHLEHNGIKQSGRPADDLQTDRPYLTLMVLVRVVDFIKLIINLIRNQGPWEFLRDENLEIIACSLVKNLMREFLSTSEREQIYRHLNQYLVYYQVPPWTQRYKIRKNLTLIDWGVNYFWNAYKIKFWF